jgi:ribonuclease BN (tRNA processing enzyme)
VRITVLGKSPAWADAGGACSGYLVESGDTCVLLDCGSGVLGKLRELRDYATVDAIVLSHLHADHMLDVVPFASALLYGPRWAGDRDGRPRPVLHGPPGTGDAFTVVCEGSGMFGTHVEDAFELREYDPEETFTIGSLSVRFRPVPHYVPAQAVEFAEGGRRLTFSSDCGPNVDLCAFARDTDLLLIEASVTEAGVAADAGERGHLTPREAGEHGRRAGARRVVLTHVSDELDAEAARAEAEAAYGGPVELAVERAIYEV